MFFFFLSFSSLVSLKSIYCWHNGIAHEWPLLPYRASVSSVIVDVCRKVKRAGFVKTFKKGRKNERKKEGLDSVRGYFGLLVSTLVPTSGVYSSRLIGAHSLDPVSISEFTVHKDFFSSSAGLSLSLPLSRSLVLFNRGSRV